MIELERDIEDLSQEEKAKLVTTEYILAKFVDVVEGIGIWKDAKPAQALKALQLLGDWKKMFVQHKKVDINIGGFVRGLPDAALSKIIDVEAAEIGTNKDSGVSRISDGNERYPGL